MRTCPGVLNENGVEFKWDFVNEPGGWNVDASLTSTCDRNDYKLLEIDVISRSTGEHKAIGDRLFEEYIEVRVLPTWQDHVKVTVSEANLTV